MLIFKNKITFISGATGNIGKKLCEKFALEGSDLIITDKNRKGLETIKKKLNKRFNIKVNYVESDLTDYESRVTMLKFIKKNFKKIDFIINNAGFTGSQRNKLDWNGNIDEVRIWDRALTEFEIQFNQWNQIDDASINFLDGLKGYWRFNSGEGNSVIDYSGNGGNALITNAQWSTNSPVEIPLNVQIFPGDSMLKFENVLISP